MAKSFYTPEEASQILGRSVDDLQELVKNGKIREFRDGGDVRYKAADIDKIAPAGSGGGDDIVLEPADESDIVLASASSDALTLEDVDSADDAGGTRAAGAGKKDKEGTVVSSVGVSVFDDDELDEVVDPLAQTAISDVGDLGLDGAGSGSGILDLTRESDDTSLGAELLDEIYTGEEEATVEMGDDTRAGLDEGSEEGATVEEDEALEGAPVASSRRAVAVTRVQYAPDAASAGLTALMAVATFVMLFCGLAATGMMRGVLPGIVSWANQNLMYCAGGAVLVAVISAVAAFMVAKR